MVVAIDRLFEVIMQIDFPFNRARAVLGQKVDATPSLVVSAVSDIKIPFGSLVVYDDSDTFMCKPPINKAQLEKALGITLHQLYCEEYQPKTSIAALRKGRVWIEAEKVAASGDAVYVKFVEGGIAKFTGDKKDNSLLKGAIFLERSEGGLVPVEVDFFGGAQ